VDATGGSDNNLGTSSTSAWQTIAMVNGRTFVAGDNILFKRGETWREQLRVPSSGKSGSPITFGAYGMGAKPRLLGSVNRSQTKDWTNESGSIWYASAPVDVGNLIFDGGLSWGVKKRYKSDLGTQDDFWFDSASLRVYMYSSVNPASKYNEIECALNDLTGDYTKGSIVRVSTRDYITVQDLEISYGGNLGVDIKRGSGNVIIERCDFRFIGGGYQPEPTRLGNAVQYWGDSHDCIVRYCNFDQIYDAAITAQYDGTPTSPMAFRNLFFYYNIIDNSEYSFEFWFKDRNSPTICSVDNVRFENNVCLRAGYGWSHTQRPDPSGRHLMFFSSFVPMTNIYIRNNIFYESMQSALCRYSSTFVGWNNVTLSNNCYYQSGDDSRMIYFPDASYSMATFSQYQSAKGKDQNSMAADPKFVDPLADYHIQPGSPCAGTGTYVGLTADYEGNAVMSGSVDIGAFELTSTTQTPTTSPSPTPTTIEPPSNLRFQQYTIP